MSNSHPAIIFRKTKHGLAPVSAYDAEQMDAFIPNTEFDIKPRTKRSNPQNRLYWQVLTRMVAATKLRDRYPNARKLHKALLREVGMVDVSFDLDGTPRLTEDSTAFDAMSAEDFKAYFDAAIEALADIIGADPLSLSAPASVPLDALVPGGVG
jgi:hypothetical protein